MRSSCSQPKQERGGFLHNPHKASALNWSFSQTGELPPTMNQRNLCTNSVYLHPDMPQFVKFLPKICFSKQNAVESGQGRVQEDSYLPHSGLSVSFNGPWNQRLIYLFSCGVTLLIYVEFSLYWNLHIFLYELASSCLPKCTYRVDYLNRALHLSLLFSLNGFCSLFQPT